MSHPVTHAESSVRKWGGRVEDYLPIHDLMDSSKAAFPDNRHRALTHNSWFIFVVEKVFGHEIEVMVPCSVCRGLKWIEGTPCRRECYNCRRDAGPIDRLDNRAVEATGLESKKVKTRYICEQHILEDFGGKYIPTASDYLEGMEFQDWMNNGIKGAPTSHRKLATKTGNPKTRRQAFTLD